MTKYHRYYFSKFRGTLFDGIHMYRHTHGHCDGVETGQGFTVIAEMRRDH